MHQDFSVVCDRLNLPLDILPKEVLGDSKDYKKHYSNSTIDMVNQIYREEINLFKYTF